MCNVKVSATHQSAKSNKLHGKVKHTSGLPLELLLSTFNLRMCEGNLTTKPEQTPTHLSKQAEEGTYCAFQVNLVCAHRLI